MLKPLEYGAFDPEMTCELAAAFEKAWRTLQANTDCSDAARAAAMREALAKAVIAAGRRQSAMDADRVADVALAIIRSSSR